MNKRVFVTGASRGIGKSIAQKYKEHNWTVIGVGTSEQKIDYLDEYHVCNFSDKTQIENLCHIVTNKNIDVLINNAGINKISNFIDIDPLNFLEIQQVNVYAPFRLCQSVLPNMLKKNWGRIINISSVWGKRSKTGRASYSASKFAIDGITISLADEFSKNGCAFAGSFGCLNNLFEEGSTDASSDVSRQNE